MINASQGLALIRMGFGLYFLSQAFGAVSNGWLSSGAQLGRQLRGSLQRGAEGFYRPFLEQVVLPRTSSPNWWPSARRSPASVCCSASSPVSGPFWGCSW